MIKVLSQHLPGETDENHRIDQPEYLVSQLRFELITSKIQVWGVIPRPAFPASQVLLSETNIKNLIGAIALLNQSELRYGFHTVFFTGYIVC
jgi:hypothetical protein